jgi:hypothetical protein
MIISFCLSSFAQQIDSISSKESIKNSNSVKTEQLKEVVKDTIKKDNIVTSENITEIPEGILFGKFDKTTGPLLIKGSIIVPSGQILEFGPGCKILVGGDYSTITVFGQIIAKGTSFEPVTFESAKPKPNPWDWDRIYIRSRNRSTFEHCIIKHSNYGIMAENSSVYIKNCRFEKNSLHGLVVRNSDVNIYNSIFVSGHVAAILCDEGANVLAESLQISNNINGVAVSKNALFNLRDGIITNNTTGIIFRSGSFVSVVGANITKNLTGVLSQITIPRKTAEMVYGNGVDIKVATEKEINSAIKPPETIKTITLPKSVGAINLPVDFKAGFSALRQPAEQVAGFLGNITTGIMFFDPISTSDSLKQAHFPGEEKGYTDNIQPELQLFANGKSHDADVSLMLDIFGNKWTGVRRNTTTLSMSYSNQSLYIGDFFESNSETSISGRKITGLKYDGNFWEMGRGEKRINVRAAFGQSEIPKQAGGHEIDLYNVYVDTGMSIRQQMTYEAAITFKPTINSSIAARGLIARDQAYKTFIGQIAVKDKNAPNLLQSQTGCIEGKIDFFEGKLLLTSELDMGISDTLVDTTEDTTKISKIAWYDPQVPEAVSKVFGVIPKGKNYAFTAGLQTLINGYKLNLVGSQIAPSYFSAGNPYLEIDRRILTLGAEKDFSENTSANLNLEYQRRTMTVKPVDNATLRLAGRHYLGQYLPEFNLDYMFYYETSKEKQSVSVAETTWITSDSGEIRYNYVDKQYIVKDFRNMIGIEGKQQFANEMDYSLKYQLLWEKDATKYAREEDKDKRSGMQHQLIARYGFKIGKIFKNRLMVRIAKKDEVLDSLQGFSYKIGDDLRFSLIPRKLVLNLKGEFSNRLDKRNTEIMTSDTTISSIRQSLLTRLYNIEAEIKYTFNPKWSFNLMGKYESSLDQQPGSRENYNVKIIGFHVSYIF